jgi:ribosomal protein L6P/L9E
MKKHIIKMSNDIKVIYSNKKKIILIIGILTKKLLKLNLQLLLINLKNSIQVSKLPFYKMLITKKKDIKIYQKTIFALIKQNIIEVSIILYQKLKFIGIGYRVLDLENFSNKLLLFKLGFSHLLYFKIPKNIKTFCLKSIKLFLSSNSFCFLTQIASLIKSYKKPEPYKGKGILYENEKIQIKEGKKS